MSSESKDSDSNDDYDCTSYGSPKCPKGELASPKPIKKINDSLHVAMVGCWGVYGWDKEIFVKEYNLEKILPKELKNISKLMKDVDTIGEVAGYEENLKGIFTKLQTQYKNAEDDEKKNVVIDKFFISTPEEYGQEKVIKGIAGLPDLSALFLAGDNVYSYNTPKDKLVELIKKVLNGNEKDLTQLPTKRGYKKNPDFSPQQIKEQLSEGFTNLVNKVNMKTNIFLGIGNHDIQTCDDLNTQLNYKHKGWRNNDKVIDPDPRYGLHGTYYNVVYEMNDYKVNFIIIDTNMFLEDDHCDGSKYNKTVKDDQIEWVINTLNTNMCKFNIIIGHSPYIANPHKMKEEKAEHIHNKQLEQLLNDAKARANKYKVQVYMCADEHNQQFLYHKNKKLSLVVAGSGGTARDMNIFPVESDEIDTGYNAAVFGFVGFKFSKELIEIQYYTTEVGNEIKKPYNVKINQQGDIQPKTEDAYRT